MTCAVGRLTAVLLAMVLFGCAEAPGPILAGPATSTSPADADELSSETLGGFATASGSEEESADTVEADATIGIGGRSPFTVVASVVSPSITAYVEPDESAAVIEEFTNPTAVGSPLVFRAVDGGAADDEWIQVHLPVQPNGSTGWVKRSDVALSNNPFRIEVDRASHSLRVFNQNSLWLETEVAIGTGGTPTPVGDFYLLELLAPPDPSGPYGPFAFGLSGFSEVLESFGGADTAIIGLHGTNDPASLGTDVSHGCIRIENSIIEMLAASVPLGTPVLIT